MKCPACGSENLPGLEVCEECGGDLSDLDVPRPTGGLQARIMGQPLKALRPAPPVLLPPSAPASDAVKAMREKKIQAVIVGTKDRLVGIVTERDLLYRVGPGRGPLSTPLSAVMTADPVSLAEDQPIASALNQMSVGGFRHIPVVRDGRPAGIISIRDVLRYLCGDLP